MYTFLTLVLFSFALTNTYTVVPESSSIEWIGSKVTGSHNGFISLTSGTVTMKDNKIKKSELFVDMNSITNIDINSEGSRNYLVKHLKGEDFFDVENFPSSHIAFIQFNEDSTSTSLTCDITIKGITNRVEFPVEIALENETAVAKGSVVVDRTKHNIKYKSKTFFKEIGDKFIYDEFTLNFSVFARLDKSE